MKVKLLVSRSGDRFTQEAGQVIEVSNTEGKRLVEKGRAEPVKEQRETATRKQRETT